DVCLASFFFHAEGGIRDDLVTGVQPCVFRSALVARSTWRKGVQPDPPNCVVTSASPFEPIATAHPPASPKASGYVILITERVFRLSLENVPCEFAVLS